MNSPNMQYCAPQGGEGLAEIEALSDIAEGEAEMDALALLEKLKLMLADFEPEAEADSDGLGPLGEIEDDCVDEIDALALPTEGEADCELD